MKTLVLSNPGAARARRHLAALGTALPECPDLRHCLPERPEQLADLVGHGDWQPDDLLVINGGDGTVQHALTALLANCPAERLPRIACLPGGSTNMTAFDINRHRGFKACLNSVRDILDRGQRTPTHPRPVVRVRRPDPDRSSSARCGMFFGMGTIVQGIDYFQQRVGPSGGKHELGAGVALARTLWGIGRRQPPFSEALTVTLQAPGLLEPPPASNCRDGALRPVAIRLLLVTTLDRLFLGIRPYWQVEPGRLKATLVEADARRFIVNMPRLLRGRPNPAMTPGEGYHSGSVERLCAQFTGSYTLDGEIFSCVGGQLIVEPTQAVGFLPL